MTLAVEPVTPDWDSLVQEHSGRVRRHAYRLTGNAHDADDLTQDVFVRAFDARHTYTPGSFEGWLHRITTNLFIDGFRRRRRIRFDALGENAEEYLPAVADGPEATVLDHRFEPDVEEALATLPGEFRDAVVLRDVDGLTYDEIAGRLGVKTGTVRSRIHRGRTMLRQALAHRAPAPGRSRVGGPAVNL